MTGVELVCEPIIKREVAIDNAYAMTRTIRLYATPDAAQDFSKFGLIDRITYIRDCYWLRVDARYDFDDVLTYIKAYAGEASPEGDNSSRHQPEHDRPTGLVASWLDRLRRCTKRDDPLHAYAWGVFAGGMFGVLLGNMLNYWKWGAVPPVALGLSLVIVFLWVVDDCLLF